MIRKATKEDVTRTSEIHTYGWRTAYDGLISEKELYNSIHTLRSTKIHNKIIEDPNEQFDVYDDGIIRGIIIHGNSRDEDENDFYEVYAIYIEPKFMKRGYGQKLLEYIEIEANNQNKKNIIIWTLDQNISARKFYERNNYSLDGKEKIIDKWNLKEVRYSKCIKP